MSGGEAGFWWWGRRGSFCLDSLLCLMMMFVLMLFLVATLPSPHCGLVDVHLVLVLLGVGGGGGVGWWWWGRWGSFCLELLFCWI